MRLGSARVLTRSFSSSAEIRASIWMPWVLITCASNAPNGWVADAAPGKTPLPMAPPMLVAALVPLAVDVETLLVAEFEMAPSPEKPIPFLFPPNQFTPRSRCAVRSTSRKRTFSMTCWEAATLMASMTGACAPPCPPGCPPACPPCCPPGCPPDPLQRALHADSSATLQPENK